MCPCSAHVLLLLIQRLQHCRLQTGPVPPDYLIGLLRQLD